MSDQNQFDQYREKILQYWKLFLAFLGRAWAAVKRGGKRLAQMLALLALKVRDFLTQEVAPRIRGVGEWLASLLDWARSKLTRQPQVEAPVLPPVEEVPEIPAPAEQVAVVSETTAPAEQTETAPVTPVEPARNGGKELLQKTGKALGTVGGVVKTIGRWIWRLRKLIMAAPVVYAALKLAADNMDRLPDMVGLDIQSTGEFARMVSRDVAVYCPLALTVFCLLLMFCSKKTLLPWIISIFTLILPVLIWLTNYYA